MNGGDTTLAKKLRRLLVYLGVAFGISVFTEFTIFFIQAGHSLWSGGGTDVLRGVTTALFAVACVLLVLGSLRLRDCRPSARRTLLSASVIWVAAIVGILSIQAGRVIDRPRAGASWQAVIREAETWTVHSGALPLLLFAFAGWPELIPRPGAMADGPSEPDAHIEQSSLAARLMRVLSVYGVVFGGATLTVLVYTLVSRGKGLPELHFSLPLRDAFYQFGALLGWMSAALIIVGAAGELFGATWGRHFLLIAAAAWLAATLCSLVWSVLLYASTSRHGGSMASQLADYVLILLGQVEQCVFPVMLLVCLCWREMRVATAGGGSTGFQPIIAQSADDGRPDDSEGSPEELN